MVFGSHPIRSIYLITSDVMKRTQFHKGDPIFNTKLLKHTNFLEIKTAAAWLRSDWMSHSKERCDQLSLFSSVCTVHSARSAFSVRSSFGTSLSHFSEKTTTIFLCSASVSLFLCRWRNAKVPAQCIFIFLKSHTAVYSIEWWQHTRVVLFGWPDGFAKAR